MTLYYPPTSNALQKTLGAALDESATTVTLNNVTGIQNKAGVFVVDRVDSNGTVKSASDWEWVSFTGTSGSTLTGLTRGLAGSSDQDHATGAIVEFVSDITWAQGVISALANSHTSAGAVDTTKVVDLTTAQTLTNKNISSATNTLPTAVVTLTGTQTLTNKTITPIKLVNTVVSSTPEAAATDTLDLSTGNIFNITMPEGNITIAVSNETVGQCFLIEITQDSTGSREVTWFSTIKWAGGSAPTLTTTGSKRDTFGFRVTGTDTYDGFIVGQNV